LLFYPEPPPTLLWCVLKPPAIFPFLFVPVRFSLRLFPIFRVLNLCIMSLFFLLPAAPPLLPCSRPAGVRFSFVRGLPNVYTGVFFFHSSGPPNTIVPSRLFSSFVDPFSYRVRGKLPGRPFFSQRRYCRFWVYLIPTLFFFLVFFVLSFLLVFFWVVLWRLISGVLYSVKLLSFL